MYHEHQSHTPAPADPTRAHGVSLTRLAFTATLHCLSGCAIGEVLGMMVGTALAVGLAFILGYAFTMVPLLRAGMAFGAVLKLARAADTVSIVIMEVVDNAIMLVIPGAMDAQLTAPLFWAALAMALSIAGVAAFPVNRWLISRGKGHAVVHAHHGH